MYNLFDIISYTSYHFQLKSIMLSNIKGLSAQLQFLKNNTIFFRILYRLKLEVNLYSSVEFFFPFDYGLTILIFF